jgi:voltage-gated potassium channel
MSLYSNLPSSLKRKLVYAHLSIFIMLAIGTTGFHYFENLSWLESIYFTTATVTTVGYGDIVPHTKGGRIFTTFFVLFGVGTVLYALSILAQSFIQTEVLSALGMRRKTKEMRKLSNHYIICGAGRVGRRIIQSLVKEKTPFVVIEIDHLKIERIENADKYLIFHADATIEENLRTCGVERAAGLVSCLSDDAKNVYVVLTARNLNRNLHIVSRAVEEQAEPKLIQAGANRVVSPTIIGSLSMTRALIRPAIADFMDSIVAENLDLVFEEIPISNHSIYARKPLKETNISNELSILIVAIRRQGGEMIFNPSAETLILEKDLLIVIGKAEAVQKLIQANK